MKTFVIITLIAATMAFAIIAVFLPVEDKFDGLFKTRRDVLPRASYWLFAVQSAISAVYMIFFSGH